MRHIPEPPVNMDRATYEYLYKLQELVNLALDEVQTQADKVPETIRQLAQKTGHEQSAAELRSLIIKTADTVTIRETIEKTRETLDNLAAKLEREYLATSEFGTYLEQNTMELTQDATGQTQKYTFFSWLKANLEAISNSFEEYKVRQEGYIRTGIVDYQGNVPIYGMAVGRDLSIVEADGETVIQKQHFRSVFTADRLGFWQDNTEVAYISNDQLFIRNARILEDLVIQDWKLDSDDTGLALKWEGA